LVSHYISVIPNLQCTKAIQASTVRDSESGKVIQIVAIGVLQKYTKILR